MDNIPQEEDFTLDGSPPETLHKCPCGETPTHLYISQGATCKWAFASGSCCGEWSVEFCTDFKETYTEECAARAKEAWNTATRATTD